MTTTVQTERMKAEYSPVDFYGVFTGTLEQVNTHQDKLKYPPKDARLCGPQPGLRFLVDILHNTFFPYPDIMLYSRLACGIRMKHLILWCLFYRWWFIYSLPKPTRPYFMPMIRGRRYFERPYAGSFWANFMLYHPLLFLIIVAWRTLKQFTVKLFPVPGKAFSVFRKKCFSRCKTTENRLMDNALAGEGGNMPPNSCIGG
jgi:hypothetical protein